MVGNGAGVGAEVGAKEGRSDIKGPALGFVDGGCEIEGISDG